MQIALLSISRCSLKLRLCHTCKFLALPQLLHHLPLCTLLLFWSSNEVPQTHKPGTQLKDASSLLIKPERRSCHSLRNDINEKDKDPPCEFVRWLTPFKFCVCYLRRRTVYVSATHKAALITSSASPPEEPVIGMLFDCCPESWHTAHMINVEPRKRATGLMCKTYKDEQRWPQNHVFVFSFLVGEIPRCIQLWL